MAFIKPDLLLLVVLYMPEISPQHAHLRDGSGDRGRGDQPRLTDKTSLNDHVVQFTVRAPNPARSIVHVTAGLPVDDGQFSDAKRG